MAGRHELSNRIPKDPPEAPRHSAKLLSTALGCWGPFPAVSAVRTGVLASFNTAVHRRTDVSFADSHVATSRQNKAAGSLGPSGFFIQSPHRAGTSPQLLQKLHGKRSHQNPSKSMWAFFPPQDEFSKNFLKNPHPSVLRWTVSWLGTMPF